MFILSTAGSDRGFNSVIMVPAQLRVFSESTRHFRTSALGQRRPNYAGLPCNGSRGTTAIFLMSVSTELV